MSYEGERVPLVFHPRFTTLTATSPSTEYITTPMDMLGFNSISVTTFRTKITGSGTPTIAFAYQQSSDLVSWADLIPVFDPSGGINVAGEMNHDEPIARRYVRLKITIECSAEASVTLFAVGWATRTTS